MYYKTLDENFAQVIKLFEDNISQEQLFEYLKTGNIVQRQVSAIKISEINSYLQANILVSNLVGQDGKIREAVSLKIRELCSNDIYVKYFMQDVIYTTFLSAITDINGNICRNIISVLKFFAEDKSFYHVFVLNLLTMTDSLIEKVEQFDYKDGKYKVNKEAFKLYWCLEAIYEIYHIVDINLLKPVLLKAKDVKDYTIREKVAKILSKDMNNPEFEEINMQLHNDSNYYVRRYSCNI